MLDPHELKGLSGPGFDAHGVKELDALVRHYGRDRRVGGETFRAIVDPTLARVQYSTLKEVVLKCLAEKWEGLSVTERCQRVWGDIEKNMGGNASQFMEIVASVLVAQPHCVDNERIHGVRKLIESDKRGQLLLSTVDKLLRIGYNSPELRTSAAEHFYGEIALAFEGAAKRRM